ncbi:unnamed protein product [Ectocarpus sp. CCAP 1310/34]|nr:unnamed protein product [Ectocarpus sp. CCAP 1310/34]
MGETGRVRVAVRVRPLLSFEKTERLGECLSCIPQSKQLCVGDGGDNGRNTFTFDFTFPKSCEQRSLYDDCVASLLEAFFEGFNATILAYGQTGSGKTYTMGSASSLRIAEEEQGIIPRVITGMYDLLREALEERPNVSYSVRCQFLEIYGEEIHDLLEPAGSTVTIREGQNGEVNVHGAKEMLVNGAEEMAMLLERGSLCRTTGSTLMNAHSSRSHAIFTVLLEQRIRPEGEAPVADERVDPDDVEIRRSKFHFVDLAGSERAKRTGASGQRFKEGVDINKGLLTLGNVISALGDDTKRGKVHVPYRDSKLTRMLQDSLGGNSQTLMICCVSPSESNMHETLSALRYANRARDVSAETLRELAAASTPARQSPRPLARASFSRSGPLDASVPVQRELTMLRARVAEAEGEVVRLTEETKLARKRESDKDDALAGVRAELDLAHEALRGGTGTDQLMLDIAEAAEEGVGDSSDAAAAAASLVEAEAQEESTGEENISPKARLGGVLKGFFSGSAGSTTRSKSPGSCSSSDALGDGGGTQRRPEGEASGREPSSAAGAPRRAKPEAAARERALAVVKDFHQRIQALEGKLHDSERQRAALERQLVQSSGGGAGSGARGSGAPLMVGLSAKLAAAAAGDTGELGTDAVAEANKRQRRLAEEKRRRDQLIKRLGAGGEDGAGGVKAAGDSGTKVHDDEEDDEDEDDEDEEEDEDEGQGEEDGDEVGAAGMTRLSLGSSVVTGHEEEERALRQSETKINAELSDLDKSIILKEALLAQIKEGQASYETMQQHYEHKLREMDVEVHRHEQEHERLLSDLAKLEKQTEVAVQSEREKLQKQLKDKTAALAKAKERQSELSVLSRDRRIKQDTMRGLETEILKMKKNKLDLQRRLDSEKKRQREILMQKSKEIMSLKRSAMKDQAEVKRLERAKSKAEAVSKRHLDELALIRRLQRQKLGVGRKQKLTAQERETKRLLDKKDCGRFSSLTDQRQLRDRDARTRARVPAFASSRSDNRLSPRPPVPRFGGGTSAKQQPAPPPPQQQQQHHEAGKAGEASSVSPPSTENEEMTLRAALPAEGGLDEEEMDTLREVEERLESNKVELEYKDRKIDSIQQEVNAWAERRRMRRRDPTASGAAGAGTGKDSGQGKGSEVGEAQMIEELESGVSDLKGAKGIIRVLFSSLVAARRGLKQKTGAVKGFQEELDKQRRALEDTQELRQTELRSYDRKLTSLTADYERKINGLINHTGMSGLLHAAIERTEGGDGAPAAAGTLPGDGTTGPPVSERRSSGLESSGRHGVGVGDTTQDAMAKVLHERWLSERKKARSLESRLKESEVRIGDLEEVRKHERKALADKEQDEEWLSYELRAYRARYSQLRDERDRLKVELDRVRRSASGTGVSSSGGHAAAAAATATTTTSSGLNANSGSHHARHPSPSSAQFLRGHSGSGLAAPPPPPVAGSSSPTQSGPPSPPPRPTSGRGVPTRDSYHGPGSIGGGSRGSSPSRRQHEAAAAAAAAAATGGVGLSPDASTRTSVGERAPGDRGQQAGRMSPSSGGGGDREVMSPDNPASDVGSEYDDVDSVDEHESEGGGDVNFAGVTSDLEAIRQGRMPESMQLVARVNAEAGGKVSVFDRLASTTTESRRQKVNDRDQLHENLRRKAKQDAFRKKKDFKVVPGHLPGANGLPTGTMGAPGGGGSSSGHVSVADAIASLEGGKSATYPGAGGIDGSSGSAATGPKELSVFERLQNSYIRRRSSSSGDPHSSSQSHSHGHGHASTTTPPRSRTTSTTPATTPTPTPTPTAMTPSSGSVSVAPHRKTAKSPSPAFYSPVRQAPANHAKLSGGTHKKYVKVGGPTTVASRLFMQQHAEAAAAAAAVETSRASSNSGSPPRAMSATSGSQAGSDEKDRSVNSDDALGVVDEEGLGLGGRRDREKKQFGTSIHRDSGAAAHATGQRGSYTGASGSGGGGGNNAAIGGAAGAGDNSVFDRLPYSYTESERKRRQPEAAPAPPAIPASSNPSTGRQPFSIRRSSQDKEAVAVSATAAAAAAAAGGPQNPLLPSRRSVELEPGGGRSDERGGR